MPDLPFPVPETKWLSRRQAATYAAVVDAVIPRTERLTVECVDRVVLLMDTFLGTFPWYLRVAFRLGLEAMELVTLFTRHHGRLSRLPRAARSAFFERWLRSRFAPRREFVKGFVGLSLMGFYSEPEVQRHIGFEHQPYFDRLAAARKKLLDHERA